ncbi:unnamed protein product [Trichobilharzia regenti]|nr:unnamed protein product [Trichobilharzia regenti]
MEIKKRSNLASLIPSNHYASVAASDDLQRRRYERRRTRGYTGSNQDPSILVEKMISGPRLPNNAVAFDTHDSTSTVINPSGNVHHRPSKFNPSMKDNSFSSLSYHRNGQWIPCDLPLGYDYQPTASQGLQLSWRKKVYEFFSAPVTRFYLHVVSFCTPVLLGSVEFRLCIPYQLYLKLFSLISYLLSESSK